MRIETSSDDPQSPPADEVDVNLDDAEVPDTDLDDAEVHDVDLDDAEVLDADTAVDVIEYLGEYESVEAYLQSILADLVDPAIVWILEHLDYETVQGRCEADGCRYFREGTAVYVTRSAHG